MVERRTDQESAFVRFLVWNERIRIEREDFNRCVANGRSHLIASDGFCFSGVPAFSKAEARTTLNDGIRYLERLLLHSGAESQ